MQGFFDFIKSAPTSYHATEQVRQRLLSEGFTELYEGDEWELSEDGRYFTVRGGSALVAFKAVKNPRGFMIAAAHTDSPSFKVKVNEQTSGAYTRISTEKYGGMIMYSWLDRPLSVAGRLIVKTDEGIKSVLVNLDSDALVIPSVSIHYNRTVNDGIKLNPAKDTVPLLSTSAKNGTLVGALAKNVGVKPEDVLNHDLFVYVREEPRIVGIDGEFILSPRLDDLECVYASTEAFISAENTDSVPVLALYDSEEVGSATVTGADSTFLTDVLSRIAKSSEKLTSMLSSSLAVSADNAHALHPNSPELSDAQNAPVLGGGVVIKYNSNRRYATDGVSAAIFSEICKRAGVTAQSYYNRADTLGGSTLGALLNTQVAVPTVDIGLCQLAMHSAVETAAASDLFDMREALKKFFETSISVRGNEIKIK